MPLLERNRLLQTLRATLLAPLLLFAVSDIANAAALLRSDGTWKVTPTAPAADWNTNAGFNDAAWQDATVLYDVGTVIGDPNFLGTKGIWSSGGQFSTTETQIWIRKSFTEVAPFV